MSNISGAVLSTFQLCGLEFKTKQDAQILWDELEKIIEQNGGDLSCFKFSSLDILDREYLVSTLGKLFTGGKEWPRYGDNDEYKAEFYQQFNDEAIKRGFMEAVVY